MNFYYGMVDEANKSWGFVEETDNRAWQDAAHTELKPTMIFLTNEEWQAVLSEQSKGKVLAWYNIPMLSNKPSSEFIQFYRYTNNYRTILTDGFYKIFLQKLML